MTFWVLPCALPKLGEVSLNPLLLDIPTSSYQGQSFVVGGSWPGGGSGEHQQTLNASATTFCAVQLTHHTGGGGGSTHRSPREGMQAAAILVPLFQHQLSLSPFLTPKGIRGLSRSMVL